MSLPLSSLACVQSIVDIDYDSEQAFDFLTLLSGDVSAGENSNNRCYRFSLRMDGETMLFRWRLNARNLADHGFKQIIELARATTACRSSCGSLQHAEQFFDTILHGRD